MKASYPTSSLCCFLHPVLFRPLSQAAVFSPTNCSQIPSIYYSVPQPVCRCILPCHHMLTGVPRTVVRSCILARYSWTKQQLFFRNQTSQHTYHMLNKTIDVEAVCVCVCLSKARSMSACHRQVLTVPRHFVSSPCAFAFLYLHSYRTRIYMHLHISGHV